MCVDAWAALYSFSKEKKQGFGGKNEGRRFEKRRPFFNHFS